MLLLIHSKSDYLLYGAISIFAASASNIFNFINVHKYIGLRPVGNYNVRQHLKPVMIFFSMSVATTVYTNLDTVMLGFMKNDAEVGYYTAAVKIKNILVSIVTSLGTVLLPRASYYIQKGEIDQFKFLSKKALNFVCLLATPLVIYFILYAKQGILLLSGKAYGPAVLPMQLIMFTVLFIGMSNITGIQILVPLGYERIVLYSVISGAITDLVINFILIPELASSGAAIGTLVAEAVVLIVQYFSVRKQIPDLFQSVKYYKIVIAIILASAGSFWVAYLNLHTFITLLLSAILFFAIYGVSLILMKETLVKEIVSQLLEKIMPKKH